MRWQQPSYNQFAQDMQSAGFTVFGYRGRKFFNGPAVMSDNVPDVISKTSVGCTWNEKDSKWVVHPRTEEIQKS